MNTISGRLQKLEKGFGLGPETEDERRLRERLEAARRRRMAATGASGEDGSPVGQDQAPDRARSDRKAISGRTIIENLRQGRERARAQAEHLPRAADAWHRRS